ncbi:hypothetical protein P153DRAFT_101148 [Dothidotthia symphoricarpi CBS 119687]|uniref:Uncharacterized protein n=1 Tax=Dothidotthia symphoricarpi CBS 119687 TaxID=1392245 RepID=A0A6A6ATQ1_9PLEO|nr:uncharacterized protein P153DRAFT_101148 [Dothidotthia symphoricarpi CBS 119687]KAF2133931.1 hypothetical protein P153DRAFT_101148 [Dothidotthia symphoricarpi CBS 119687]
MVSMCFRCTPMIVTIPCFRYTKERSGCCRPVCTCLSERNATYATAVQLLLLM